MGIERSFYRFKQGINYIFAKYNENNNDEVKKILNDEEYEIFISMSNYDKFHSYKLYEEILKNDLLKNKKIYKKLALLHDCGKCNMGLIKRIKKVLFKNVLDNHPLISFEKVKNIDIELAKLCLIHHDIVDDLLMKEFQKIDDKI